MQLTPKELLSCNAMQKANLLKFFDNVDGTTSVNNSAKIYELKVHSRFKEVGEDARPGIAGSAAIAVPRRKEF